MSCASSVPASSTPPAAGATEARSAKADTKPEPPKPPTPSSEDTIRRELTGQGRVDVEVAKHVASSMSYVTIRNGRKGLESVEVFVNHRWFLSGRLHDGQVKTLDVSRALVPGTKNKIVLVGRGARHNSAVVTISSKHRSGNFRTGGSTSRAPYRRAPSLFPTLCTFRTPHPIANTASPLANSITDLICKPCSVLGAPRTTRNDCK